MNNKKVFFLILLTLTVAGCSYFTSSKTTPTNRDAICADLKTKLMYYQTTPGMYTGQNQIDPAQQATLLNTYQKYNCDQSS